MASFLELIFSNLFLFIIIITSIFSLLNKNKEEQKKKSNQPRPAHPRPRPINKQEHPTRTVKQPEPVAMKSIENQQEEQMERLREKFQTNVKDKLESLRDSTKSEVNLETITKNKVGTSKMNQQVNLKFNQKSILQGIMMSEILGPPRSRNRYRSVIEERQIK